MKGKEKREEKEDVRNFKRKQLLIGRYLSLKKRNNQCHVFLPMLKRDGSAQAVIDVSPIFAQSLYISFSSTQKSLHILGVGQTDRRTDRHDVTLEATPS